MVRVYAIADGGRRWHVLPGGMTRVSRREDASVSMQRGGSSLDTWVRTDGPVDNFSMLPQRLQVDDIVQRRRPVSSRMGENLFWLGRYTERTEQLVRQARATLLVIDADSDAAPPVLQALSALAVRAGLAPPGVPTLTQSAHLFERAVLAGWATPGARRGRPAWLTTWPRWSAASMALRERLSSEHWGLIRRMRETFVEALQRPARRTAFVVAGAARAGPAGRPAGRGDRRPDRPHDTRPRLAAAGRGPAGRAADRDDHPAAGLSADAGAGRRRGAGAAAGAVRQRHHLPRPLPAARRPAGADRHAGAGQCQPQSLRGRAAPAAHRTGQAARSARAPWPHCWPCCRARARADAGRTARRRRCGHHAGALLAVSCPPAGRAASSWPTRWASATSRLAHGMDQRV
jgi:hypothetical protein